MRGGAKVETVQEAVAGVGALLDVVRDTRGVERLAHGAAAETPVASAAAGDEWIRAREPLGRILGDLAIVDRRRPKPPRGAHSSTKPPPMQNPMIPVRPVQSSRAVRKARAASMSLAAVRSTPASAWVSPNALWMPCAGDKRSGAELC